MKKTFFVCDHHTRTGGYESCCRCENNDPKDKRICSEAKDHKVTERVCYSVEKTTKPVRGMQLYEHQRHIIEEDPKYIGLWLGTGSGKTLTALLLARGKTLVVCPKMQRQDLTWERQARAANIKLDMLVVSKEEFRAHQQDLGKYDTVIVDEAHTCLGATPNVRYVKTEAVPKVSQIYEALCAYTARHKPKRLYLVSATIIRSPMTVWAAMQLVGKVKVDFFKFRSTFYTRLPMPGREVWVARTDSASKDVLAMMVRGMGYVGRLQDFFDVPPQTFVTKYVELTAEQKARMKEIPMEFPDPIVQIGKKHQIENGVLAGNEFSKPEIFDNNKIDMLLAYADEFPQMIVFAKYTAQIDSIAAAMQKAKKKFFILDGRTKDRDTLMQDAKTSKEYVFIAQAQISAGWELPECPVTVFASRTYSFVDYDQALGRTQRANNIKKNLYINLVVRNGPDEGVDKALKNKSDFSERIYAEVAKELEPNDD